MPQQCIVPTERPTAPTNPCFAFVLEHQRAIDLDAMRMRVREAHACARRLAAAARAVVRADVPLDLLVAPARGPLAAQRAAEQVARDAYGSRHVAFPWELLKPRSSVLQPGRATPRGAELACVRCWSM